MNSPEHTSKPAHVPSAPEPRASGQRNVTAVIAVHNRRALTERCLETLLAGSVHHIVRLVLVDDGSTDGTADVVRQKFPEAVILRGNGSLWFGGAMQWGIDVALEAQPPPDYLLLLNNDSFVRPGAIDWMIDTSRGVHSIAAAYWTEDTAALATAGFFWRTGPGLVDACSTPEWQRLYQTGSSGSLAVEAVATTVTLHPAAILRCAGKVNLKKHQHHRYDAVLSAKLRDVGASFLVSTHVLANHLYGAPTARPTLRDVSFSELLRTTLSDTLSVHHFPSMIDATWRIAPSRGQALLQISRQTLRLVAQLGAKIVQAVAGIFGVQLWRAKPQSRSA